MKIGHARSSWLQTGRNSSATFRLGSENSLVTNRDLLLVIARDPWSGRPDMAPIFQRKNVMRSTLPLLTIPLILLACGSPSESEEKAQAQGLTERCTNPESEFSVSYPAGWHTNPGDVLPPCTAFDPEPVEIPPQSEIPFEISIVVDVREVSPGELTRPSEFEEILSMEPLVIHDHDAWRVEAESTGEGLAPPGMRSFRYAIDLGDGRSLVAVTHQSNEAEYERDKEILGRMVESLELPEPRKQEPEESEGPEDEEESAETPL